MKGGETIRYSTYKTLSNWNLNILQHCSCPIQQSELFYLFIFKYILLIMLLQLSHFPPFIPLCTAQPLPPAFPSFSSCPWVICISSLASTFPILFLSSPCLFSIYHLCYLFLSLYISNIVSANQSIVSTIMVIFVL